jgi:hypothetical protein
MESYQIPKNQARVWMSVPPHPPEERTLFLSPSAETHSGSERVSDLLMRGRRFLPTVQPGAETHLVRRSAIRWVMLEAQDQVEFFGELCQGSPEARIRCEFPDDERLEGVIHAVMPTGEQRVLDVVNRQEGFLPLETPAGLYLINPDHISRIFIVEESHASS